MVQVVPEDIWTANHDLFLESMADAASSVHNYFKDNIVYINVMKNMSVDCGLLVQWQKIPVWKDIGILISTDPIAIDRACLDLVYAFQIDRVKNILLNVLNQENGVHTIGNT